ncbi:MAG TPA: nicotinate-nucleotide adenylyltransferase [Thermoanaerobaculia bacterium]|nr:nicotinate-nucleotide adenylyltransferase [Thermoanaerobaculia bacterium]
MKIGLFGGSFDPIHWGHIRPVLEALEELGLERVVYLPTGLPPHKPDRRLAPALARYAMTELAVLAFERLWVSGLELSETAPSYTVDTLLHFRREYPGDKLHLLIGADSLQELRSWHRFEEILETADVAVLARPGATLAARREDAGALPPTALVPARIRLVANRPLDISSTEVRRCLARGERPPAGWVPDPVVDFALKYRLYR